MYNLIKSSAPSRSSLPIFLTVIIFLSSIYLILNIDLRWQRNNVISEVGRKNSKIYSHRRRKDRLPEPSEDIQNMPPWSYEHFLANMSKIITRAKDENQLHSMLATVFNPLKNLPVSQNSTRILLLTYFRSGSTFLGDLLQQNWKSFFSFEPLHMMSDGVRISDNVLDESLALVNRIYNCDFINSADYVLWAKKSKNQFLFKWNKFLWSVCRFRPKTCFDPKFIQEACRRANFHIMKITRLFMRHVEKLLTDCNKQLDDLKVVYLVRDPRGIWSSRKKLNWCTQQANCTDVNVLCSEMSEDLKIFRRLRQAKPSHFFLVRYEDLSFNASVVAKKLFSDLHLPFSATARRFIQTHTNAPETKTRKRNPYSTTRNSSSIPLEWKTKLDADEILQIESDEICAGLIKGLGYEFTSVDDNEISDNGSNTHDDVNNDINRNTNAKSDDGTTSVMSLN